MRNQWRIHFEGFNEDLSRSRKSSMIARASRARFEQRIISLSLSLSRRRSLRSRFAVSCIYRGIIDRRGGIIINTSEEEVGRSLGALNLLSFLVTSLRIRSRRWELDGFNGRPTPKAIQGRSLTVGARETKWNLARSSWSLRHPLSSALLSAARPRR